MDISGYAHNDILHLCQKSLLALPITGKLSFCEAQARVRQGSARIGKGWPGKGQARIGKDWQGMAHKAKGLKASLPRAYIKVGCHLPPPTHPPERLIFTMFMASRVRGRYLGITESMLDQ